MLAFLHESKHLDLDLDLVQANISTSAAVEETLLTTFLNDTSQKKKQSQRESMGPEIGDEREVMGRSDGSTFVWSDTLQDE